MTRRKYQRGSIHKRGKRKKVWVARYSEDVIGPDGVVSRIRRSEILGTVAQIPTLRQAEQLLSERLRRFIFRIICTMFTRGDLSGRSSR